MDERLHDEKGISGCSKVVIPMAFYPSVLSVVIPDSSAYIFTCDGVGHSWEDYCLDSLPMLYDGQSIYLPGLTYLGIGVSAFTDIARCFTCGKLFTTWICAENRDLISQWVHLVDGVDE